MNSLCVRNETPKRHMKFVVVNGRTPRPQSFCASCCKSIGGSYLRELTTRLSYCDDICYAGKCKVALLHLNRRAAVAASGAAVSGPILLVFVEPGRRAMRQHQGAH